MQYNWSALALPYRWQNLAPRYDMTLAMLVR
jgi:hypothetical protein